MDLKQKLTSLFEEKNIPETQREICQSAFETFKQQGFPSKKLEAWKYTSLNSVLKDDYTVLPIPAKQIDEKEIQRYLLDTDGCRLVFVNGIFNSSLSQIQEDSLSVIPLQKALSSNDYQEDINKYLYQIASREETMTALNTAYGQDGAFIRVKKGKAIENPVQILYISTDLEMPLFTQPHNLIILEENTEIKVIERHHNLSSQRVFTNSVTEIFTDKSAFVDYYKIQDDTENSVLVDNTYARQKDKSHASVHTFSFGGDITRNNLNFYQEGEYMESTLKGITILDNRQHVDHYTLVNHAEPNCESHQDYKSILSGRSTNAFNGKIMVEKIAQKTNAYQQNDNILLSDKATVYTKPQLEIFADDVKCSHGCTIGQLDNDAVFYLQSRGIPKKEAEALLTYAFAHTVLNSVRIPEVNTLIERIIARKLGVEQMGISE